MNLRKCQQCHRVQNIREMSKIVLKSKRQSYLLCPICTAEFYKRQTKDMDITNQTLRRLGFADKGIKDYDVKKALETWSKGERWVE